MKPNQSIKLIFLLKFHLNQLRVTRYEYQINNRCHHVNRLGSN